MAAYKIILTEISDKTGLFINRSPFALYGTYKKYLLFIKREDLTERKNNIVICFCVKRGRNAEQLAMFLSLPKECKIHQSGYKCSLYMPVGGKNGAEKAVGLLDSVAEQLDKRGFYNCDEHGNDIQTNVYIKGSAFVFMSAEEADKTRVSLYKEEREQAYRDGNFMLGLVGAVIGAAFGAAVVLLMSRMGFISGLCGILMGIAIVYGYKIKGLRHNMLSACLCVFIAVFFAYLTFRLDIAFSVCGDMGIDFPTALKNSWELAKISGDFTDCIKKAIFTALLSIGGTICALWMEFDIQNKKYDIEKLE